MMDNTTGAMQETSEPKPEVGKSSAWPRLLKSKLVRRLVGLGVVGVVLLALAYGVLRFLRPGEQFEQFALPYVQDFTDIDPRKWFLSNGVWSLRDEMLAQAANLNKPASIYVPSKLGEEQPYHLSTYIFFAKQTQHAGVNFNAQYPKMTQQQHQVYIARQSVDVSEAAGSNGNEWLPMTLVAGYTNEQGDFVEQVSVPFGPDTEQYRLDLYVLGNTYTVQLNGKTMIDRRPLFYGNGLIGYYTLGPARFDTLKLTTAELAEPGEQVYVSDFDQTPGGAGWVPFGGEWEIADGELVQANPAAQDAGIGYEGSAFEEYAVQATFHHLTGSGGGLLFNMISPYQLLNAHVVRYSDQSDSLFWGYFDAQGQFTRQGFANVPPAGMETHQIQVFVGAGSYDVYLDNQLLARAVPVVTNDDAAAVGRGGGHVGLVTSLSSVAYSLVEVFPLLANTALLNQGLQTSAPQTTTVSAATPVTPTISATSTKSTTPATAIPTVESGTPTPGIATGTPAPPAVPSPTVTRPAATPRATATALSADSELILSGNRATWSGEFRGDLVNAGWRPIGGEWRFSNGSLVQQDADGFDLAVAYVRNAFRDYTYEVSFSHLDGNGGGVLFNMPYPDRLNGAHMVRYSERRPGGIFWGYYDESGKFIGQGYANVSPPGDARHTLRVVSGTTTYSVYLDDFLLAADLPLLQEYGYVGLITVQSSADFVSAQVGNAGAVPGEQTPAAASPVTAAGLYSGTVGFPEQRILSGKWEIEAGTYRQTVPDLADYIFTTGIYASAYVIEADILLPEIPDVGGGFVLQMPDRGSKAGATVVRLIRGGQGIFWGVYDESGAFRGRGSLELPSKPEGETGYRLRVQVSGNSMDIFLDDTTIAEAVILPRAEGWIGLVAFGGPVAITNVMITVGED